MCILYSIFIVDISNLLTKKKNSKLKVLILSIIIFFPKNCAFLVNGKQINVGK